MNTLELMPTEENLIQALNEDILQRNKDLVYFYDLLMAQETAGAIAIDGRWGSGKTFFVKQLLLLINAKNPRCEMEKDKKDRILCRVPFRKNNDVLDENYDLAIYFDAWENDNDTKPVLSIVYEITKQLGLTYPFDSNSDVFKMAGSIFETISGRNINNIIDALKGENPLKKFEEQKNIEETLKEFFSEILIERGNRLIIFIDELDRCKPSYAVHLLEQIKHYLCDDRITFVFSVNLRELQHTISHFYGESFDSCRYLDRFFDIRVAIPPADISRFFNKIALSSDSQCVLNMICKRIIENYNFELREVTRFYLQVKTAVYRATIENDEPKFLFPDGAAQKLILLYIVPVIIGLKIINTSLYDEFVDGNNAQPLLDIFDTKDYGDWFLHGLLNKDESFVDEENKKKITYKQKITDLYNAIFVIDYRERRGYTILGNHRFGSSSREFAISAASMLSDYADFDI